MSTIAEPKTCCSGWWFGTLLIFPYIRNVIIPTDFHSIIFQRGRAQPPTSVSFELLPQWLRSNSPGSSMGFKKSGAGCASGEILRASGRIALRGRFPYANMGGFHKWRYPQYGWFITNGKSYLNGGNRGTTILGNLHIPSILLCQLLLWLFMGRLLLLWILIIMVKL